PLALPWVKVGLVLLSLGIVAAGLGVLVGRPGVARQTPAEQGVPDAGTRPTKGGPAVRTDLHGDPLPARALTRLGTVRWRLGGLFFACAYSPDGKVLAAASADRTVSLFDAATGKRIRQLHGHQSEVTSVACSPDGHTLASGSAD